MGWEYMGGTCVRGLAQDGEAENKLSIALPDSDGFLKWIFDHKIRVCIEDCFS